MTTQLISDTRKRVVELTERMGEAARRSDWREVQRLVDERGALLNREITDDEVTIVNIVRTDRAVTELAAAERDKIKKELEKISQGRRAVNAYRDNRSR